MTGEWRSVLVQREADAELEQAGVGRQPRDGVIESEVGAGGAHEVRERHDGHALADQHLVADPDLGVMKSLKEVNAIGPRVVHGAEEFSDSVVIGMFAGKPYEIFTGRAVDSFTVLTQVSEGKVLKIKENGLQH